MPPPAATITFYSSLENKVKEIQATVGIVCSEMVFTEESMQLAAKAERLLELYAGNKDDEIVGRLSLLFNGLQPFQDVSYVKDEIRYVRGTLFNSGTDDVVLGDKSTPDLGKATIVVTQERMLKSTAGSRDSDLTGRNLQDRESTVLKNVKKATAYGKHFLDSNELPPSGHSVEDYFNAVLLGMYNEGRPLDKQVTSPPVGHFFRGYMAFRLFGPMAAEENQLRLFQQAPKARANDGRAHARQNVKDEKRIKRSKVAKSSDDPSEAQFSHSHASEAISRNNTIRVLESDMTNKHLMLSSLSKQVSNISKKVDQEIKLLEIMRDSGFNSKEDIAEQMKVVMMARKERDAKIAEEASLSDELKNAPTLAEAVWKTPGQMSALSDSGSIHSGRVLTFGNDANEPEPNDANEPEPNDANEPEPNDANDEDSDIDRILQVHQQASLQQQLEPQLNTILDKLTKVPGPYQLLLRLNNREVFDQP